MLPIQRIDRQPSAVNDGSLAAGEMTYDAAQNSHPLLQDMRVAIERGDDRTLMQLLGRAPASVLNTGFGPRATPLLVEVAAHTRSVVRLEWLLRQLTDRGAYPSVHDSSGNDALTTLLSRSDQPLQAVTLLLRRGAEVNCCNGRNLSPLHLLLLHWQGESQLVVLRMLLRRGADLNLPTPRGKTPLWLAASTPQGAQVVELLLEACPPQDRAAFVQAPCRSPAGDRGHAGTAALLHLADDAVAEQVLVLLSRHGLHPVAAARQAWDLIDTRTVERDFQGIRDTATRALARSAVGAAQAPRRPTAAAAPQAPRIMLQPPTVEATAPQLLVRPLPMPPPQAPQKPLPRQMQPAAAANGPIAHPPAPSMAAPAPEPMQPRSSHDAPALPSRPRRMAAQTLPQEPLSVVAAQFERALFIANPEPPTQIPTTEVHPRAPTPLAPSPAEAVHPRYETMSLHQVARSGPPEAFASVLALNPHALTTRDRLKNGGHMPLTLAVMSRDKRLVTLVLEALKSAGAMLPDILDAPGTDGRCALAVAIDLNAQHQAQQLLQAGASPLLPVPQRTTGVNQALRGLIAPRPAGDAAEYAVQTSRPYILTLLLQWDEQLTARDRNRPLAFDLAELTTLAQGRGAKSYTLALRAALEDAATRRRKLRSKRNHAAKP